MLKRILTETNKYFHYMSIN